MRRTLALVSTLLCLTRLHAAEDPKEDPSKTCLSALQSDPKIQLLNAKVPFDISNGQSLQVLSNSSKPSPREKVALAYLATSADHCFSTGADWRTANYPSAVTSAMTLFRIDVLSAMADLYGGKTTFGEYAQRREKLLAALKVKIDSIVAAKTTEREEANQRLREAAARKEEADRVAQAQKDALDEQRAENERQREFVAQQAEQQQADARRRAALQILMQRPAMAQPYVVPVRPVQTTNCSTFGSQTSCTTQ